MEQTFHVLLETAEWLGRKQDAELFHRWQKLVQKPQFYVTLWGHFSSGKSSLINHILERDLLPVKVIETTAVLTYIAYGKQEECVLVYNDGSVQRHELGVLKKLYQTADKEKDIYKIDEIDHIEVYLKEELLHSGLVLVDTPGVNTVLQKHQELAAEAMEQSGRILYVLGGAPTAVDKQFISQMAECGIRLSCVRTKCDEFKASEEEIKKALGKEKKEIESFAGTEIEYIPVSNQKWSSWYIKVEDVRTLLKELSCKIKEERESTYADRLQIYQEKYLTELNEQAKELKELLQGNAQTMEQKKQQYETELQKLEEIRSDIKEKVEDKVKQAEKEAKKDLEDLAEKRVENFNKEVSNLKTSEEISAGVEKLYEAHRLETLKKIQSCLNIHFDGVLKEEAEQISAVVSKEMMEIPAPVYTEVCQENSLLLERYRKQLLEIKERIEENLQKQRDNAQAWEQAKSEYEENKNADEEALRAVEEELSKIPSDIAYRIVKPEGIQPSEIGKKVGQATDLALLLLPGEVIFQGAKAAANLVKAPQILQKMGTVGEVILKMGIEAGKLASGADKVRDVAYTLNTVRKIGDKEKMEEKKEEYRKQIAENCQKTFEIYQEDKRNGNILDVLSVAYWTEKIGKNFDQKPRWEVDVKEQQLRDKKRQEISEKKNELSRKRLEDKQKLGLFKDQQDRLKAEEEEKQKREKEIEEELRKEEDNIRKKVKEAKEAAGKKYTQEYVQYYEKFIKKAAEEMQTQCSQQAAQNITLYLKTRTVQVSSLLEEKKSTLADWLSLQEKDAEQLQKKLTKCEQQIQSLAEEKICR